MARPARFELTTSAFGGLWFVCRGRYVCGSLIHDGAERSDNITRLRGHSADAYRCCTCPLLGAKRTYTSIWAHSLRPLMTQSGHTETKNPAVQWTPACLLTTADMATSRCRHRSMNATRARRRTWRAARPHWQAEARHPTSELAIRDFPSPIDQLGQFLSGIEHTCFYSRGRQVENLRYLVDRLLVVIDQVDDLTVVARE